MLLSGVGSSGAGSTTSPSNVSCTDSPARCRNSAFFLAALSMLMAMKKLSIRCVYFFQRCAVDDGSESGWNG